MIKSPFKIYKDFLSKTDIDDVLNCIRIDTKKDENNLPTSHEYNNNDGQEIIFDKLKYVLGDIEDYYNLSYKGTHRIQFQHFPENMKAEVAERPKCQNSHYSRKKWVKVKDIDLTAVLWLTTYEDNPPFDKRYDVYGGKLEFPQYNFSFTPKAGTLVVYPAYPHFITAISKVLIGDLYQARINIAGNKWLYDPKDFPFEKDFFDWFKNE